MNRRLIITAILLLSLSCKRREAEVAIEPIGPELAPPPADIFNQSFSRAVTEEVGPDQRPPVDRTIAGKSTATLREEVERLWPMIQLVGEGEKPLPWVVTLETDAGIIEIALRPELAPNHVRNLIALVRVGYFDGLRFDRLVHHQAESKDGLKSEVRLVRFGCPAGTGDPSIGHIGYRLRPEFSGEKHVAGTVGFTRDKDQDSAGVRLYIVLAPAAVLDGSYTIVGKVSKGFDTVEKIAAGKLLSQELDPTRELPERPTVIHKATAKHQ